MSHVTVTKIARLHAELHRDLPRRKKKPVVVDPAASSSSALVPSTAPSDADDAFLDLDALTSAAEFDAEVNEWFQELQREALWMRILNGKSMSLQRPFRMPLLPRSLAMHCSLC